MKPATLLLPIVLGLALAGCSTPPRPTLAQACATALHQGFAELDDAKAKGFSGSVSWVKAAALLSAAKVQEQFEKFPNCIDKVRRARLYIRMARAGT